MGNIANVIITSSVETFYWLIGFTIVFGILAKICPCNPGQPLLRKEIITDIFYCFIMPILSRFVRIIFVGAGVFFIFYGINPDEIPQYLENGYGPLAKLPIWLQAAIIFLVSDFLLYWTHRWFHTQKMWVFHAIHHSPEHVDWLSTYRFHPINIWLSFTLVDAAMLLVGFSPASVSLMASVNTIYSAMVHANLNWTFGPFKYLFASPIFHRWHHTAQQEGLNKNFAPTFPLLDLVFGTFYMPDKQLPQKYGIPDNVPSSFGKQIIWPFKQKALLSKPKTTEGFTLIELSIVLTIIGLLASVILFGRDLVRIAQTQQQVRQIEELNLVVKTFQLKFDALPGDFARAVDVGLGTSGGIGDNGNGNGFVDMTNFPDIDGAEIQNFWYHLSQAGMLSNNYATGNVPGINSPPLKMKGYGIDGNSSGGIWLAPRNSLVDLDNSTSHAWFLTTTASSYSISGVYFGPDAYGIDRTIDDGLPLTGTQRVATGMYALICVDDVCNGFDHATVLTEGDEACIDDTVNPSVYNFRHYNPTPSSISLCMPIIRAPF